jgi:hypothetical protein
LLEVEAEHAQATTVVLAVVVPAVIEISHPKYLNQAACIL